MTDLKPDNLQWTILPKIGLKHYNKRMMFPIFPVRVRPCPSPHFPPPPPQGVQFFGLTGQELSLTCWAKLKANTDIAHDNNIQVGYYNREKILRIFRLIDQVIPQVNSFRGRRLISVNFIIKQLFDILGVENKIIPLTRSKNTLRYYENWWERVYSLIKTDVDRLISQNSDRKKRESP